MNGKVLLWFRDFDHMETVLGPGGQLHSFEAVFSPRGKDGKPLRVWNRDTGEIDTAVAKTWEKVRHPLDSRTQLENPGAKTPGQTARVHGR